MQPNLVESQVTYPMRPARENSSSKDTLRDMTGSALLDNGSSVGPMAWVAGALAAALWHTFIDAQIGLMGPTSEVMTFAQGWALALDAALFGYWLYLAGESAKGNEKALGALSLIVFLDPVLTDGAVAFVVAPPPSAAFPYQDISHLCSLLFGVGALVALRRSIGWGRWGGPSWAVLALKVVGGVAGAFVFFSLPG